MRQDWQAGWRRCKGKKNQAETAKERTISSITQQCRWTRGYGAQVLVPAIREGECFRGSRAELVADTLWELQTDMN